MQDAARERADWNGARFVAGTPLGHYESWFQRANHPSRPLAFWIRYTIFSPAGRPVVFVTAVATIVVWIVTGPLFGFSDTWQLVINTATTIITFLVVFLIQSTQNRDTEAIQVKLDELIRATHGAHNALLDLEEIEEKQLDEFRQRYEALARAARTELEQGRGDTGSPEP